MFCLTKQRKEISFEIFDKSMPCLHKEKVTMETNFNIGSLKIVSGPLTDYFKKVQNNINENVQVANDRKVPVNFESIEILRKINGTLKMIGLNGVNKVLSAVSEGLEAIKNAKFDSAKTLVVLETSQEIVGNVVFYVDNLLNGELDQPTKFFEQYSSLCKLIGKNHSVKDLFSPRLEFKPDVDNKLQSELRVGVFINDVNKQKLTDTLKNAHNLVEASVLPMFESINRNNFSNEAEKNSYQEKVKNIYSALDAIQRLKISKNVFLLAGLQKLFVCIASPVFNDNFSDLLNTNLQSTKLNLGKIERSVKSILESVLSLSEGEKTGSIKVDEEVIREVLYFVINTLNKEENQKLTSMPIHQEVQSYFDLGFYENQLKEVTIDLSIAQQHPEVSQQIDKLFVELKEELGMLTGKQATNEDYTLQHSTKFVSLVNKINDLLTSVQSHELKELVSAVSHVMTSVKSKKLDFSEQIQKEVSLSLVLVEYGINNFIKSLVNENVRQDFNKQSALQISRLNLAVENKEEQLKETAMPVLDANSQKSDERKAFLVIFDKLHKDLKKSEEVLNDFFRDNENTEELDQIFKTLNSAKGIFAIINKNKLSQVVSSIIDVWKKVSSDGLDSLAKEDVSKSVSLLSGILLFVEASKNDNEIEAEEMYKLVIKKAFGEEEVIAENVEIADPVIEVPELQEVVELETVQEYVEEPSDVHEEVITENVESIHPVIEELVSETPQVEDVFEESDEVIVPETMEEIVVVEQMHPVDEVHVEHTTPIVLEEKVEKPSVQFIDTPEDEDLTEVYLIEAQEVLENLETSLHQLENNFDNKKALEETRRYFHTLKGSGRMVGLKYLGEVAWMAEQTFKKVTENQEPLTHGVLNLSQLTREQFKDWVQELAETNKVVVDLVRFKKLWLEQNDSLTTQIDIPLKDTVQHVEPVHHVVEELLEQTDTVQHQDNHLLNEMVEQESVEPEHVESVKKDTITIGGVEVSETLYQLFKEECTIHLQGLVNAVNESGFEITPDFMRHAHTLSSIARSVGLNDFAEVVGKIEFISNMVLEKKLQLTSEDIMNLKSVLVELEDFSNVLDGSLFLNENYVQAQYTLDTLQNAVANVMETKEEIEVLEDDEELLVEPEKVHVAPQSALNVDELVSNLALNLREVFAQQMQELKKSIEDVQNNVEQMTPKETVVQQPAFDPNELIDSISNKVLKTVDEQYNKLAQVLKDKEETQNKNVNDLVEKMSSLAKEFESLNKNQQQIEQLQKQNHEAIRKDLRYINSTIKKKYELSYQEVVQQPDGKVNDINMLENFVEITAKEIQQENEDEFEDVEINDEYEDLPSDLKEESQQSALVQFLSRNEFARNIFDDKISSVEDEVDTEIFEISKMECDELMEKIDYTLESIQEDSFDLAQNQEFKRLLHTLKGSVRMAGANKIGALAHRLESLLDYSETRGISLFKMKDLLLEEVAKINYLIKNPTEILNKQKADWLDGVFNEEEITSTVQEVQEHISEKTDSPSFIKREEKQYIRINSGTVDDLINDAGEVRLTRTTLEGMLVGLRRYSNDFQSSSAKLVKMLKEIEIQAEGQMQARKEKFEFEAKDFDPLEFDRFTRLQELTRLMSEAVADVQDTVRSLDTSLKTQEGAVVQQSILTNNLLDTLMKVRLLPIDTITDRLYKITRNTAKELNKKVLLELSGEKTEMDRLVLDKIISPLEHLLRNCIAHGIEEPDERMKKGKSPIGKVNISTSVDGNFIIMNIKDDGAGINLEKVKEIGIKKGLINKNNTYSEQQIVELIFQSGFSTADTISQVAGRGVGMDVVKKEVSELGGTIDIKTQQNKGTEFNIVLPVAVATNQAMLTKVGDKLVGIPTSIVEEIISIKKEKIHAAYETKLIQFRGKDYPIYYLGHMLGVIPLNQLPEIKNYNTLIAVSYLGEIVIVHVDQIETTTEILIKSMGVHFGKISGMLGATLLGDGRQGVVVNPAMLKNHYEKYITNLGLFNEITQAQEEKMKGVLTVMVVDDSITVRRATSKVLERYGYNIVLAKDGEDGLEQLQVVTPDIILSDIEMPRMDGFEFTKNVRNTEKYAHIPIVMITSRTADKHKTYAQSLGVNAFLGKPYQEDELIEIINNLTSTINN